MTAIHFAIANYNNATSRKDCDLRCTTRPLARRCQAPSNYQETLECTVLALTLLCFDRFAGILGSAFEGGSQSSLSHIARSRCECMRVCRMGIA